MIPKFNQDTLAYRTTHRHPSRRSILPPNKPRLVFRVSSDVGFTYKH